jgi:uncharacterized protein YecT (DUF1311 family)
MMRIILIFSLGLFATNALAGPGGDPPKPEVKAAVEKCLAEKAKANKPLEECIGAVSDACLSKGESLSVHDIIDCHGEEADVWDERLNHDYQALMKTMKSPAKERVRDLERAWLDFREKKCAYRQMEDEGMVGMIQNINCYKEETARQALFLSGILDSPEASK